MSRARRKQRAWELKDNLRLIAIFMRAKEICAAHGNELVGMGFP